jgi:hypothetical protein
MLLRNRNGIIVEIKRMSFITDKAYYEYIMNVI